jgi:hypothetical protein
MRERDLPEAERELLERMEAGCEVVRDASRAGDQGTDLRIPGE